VVNVKGRQNPLNREKWSSACGREISSTPAPIARVDGSAAELILHPCRLLFSPFRFFVSLVSARFHADDQVERFWLMPRPAMQFQPMLSRITWMIGTKPAKVA